MSQTSDLQYLFLVATLFLLPKILMRFKIPAAFTAFFIGVITSATLGWFQGDQTLSFISVLGITSLFLFAGLEVEIDEIKKHGRFYTIFLTFGFLLMMGLAWALAPLFDIDFRMAALVSLALITPSTGFILDSLNDYNLTEQEKNWARSLSIAMEILALAVLFFVLQTESLKDFSISTVTILAMIFLLPFIFKIFMKLVSPFAPHSEFAFLILLALLCGVITRKIGTYYLVGAFIVGLSARQFERYFPELQEDVQLKALRLFFSFFIPFYFFRSGLSIDPQTFSGQGFVIGLILFALFGLIRYFFVKHAMRSFLGDQSNNSSLVSIAMLPNLVFGLVIAGILKERFHADSVLITAIVVYTITVSGISSFFTGKSQSYTFDTSQEPSTK